MDLTPEALHYTPNGKQTVKIQLKYVDIQKRSTQQSKPKFLFILGIHYDTLHKSSLIFGARGYLDGIAASLLILALTKQTISLHIMTRHRHGNHYMQTVTVNTQSMLRTTPQPQTVLKVHDSQSYPQSHSMTTNSCNTSLASLTS